MSPVAPLRPCLAAHCSSLVHHGYCDKHRSADLSAAERGYDHTWRRFRLQYLRSVGWRCETCGLRPGDTSLLEVHHIHGLAFGGPRLDPSNCRALCISCHDVAHGGERVHLSGEPMRAVTRGLKVGTSGGRSGGERVHPSGEREHTHPTRISNRTPGWWGARTV